MECPRYNTKGTAPAPLSMNRQATRACPLVWPRLLVHINTYEIIQRLLLALFGIGAVMELTVDRDRLYLSAMV